MTGDGENKREIKLTPPPRVKTVKPVAALPRSAAGTETTHRSSGWLTIATFILLLGVAFGVFFYLPRWVETRGPAPPTDTPVEAAHPPEVGRVAPSAPLETLREQAVLKQQADEARERAARQIEALEATNVSMWGGEGYRAAAASIAEGDGYHRDKDFTAATSAYEEASEQLESLRSRAHHAMKDALLRGQNGLSAGDAAAATQAFRTAQAIEPGNPQAAAGLKRASVLNEVLRLLASGAELERRGELERAAESYRQAVSLDPLSRDAQQALSRLDSRFTDEAFRKAMSEGVAALDRKDYQAAREAFEQARAIKPGAPEVADGLAQAEEGARLDEIAERREKGLALEGKEEWRLAAAEYQSVLDLDPTIRFAQEGKARCETRAELDDRLRFHLKNPHRLSDENVLQEVSRLLLTASSIEPAGPMLSEQVVTLRDMMKKASTPVRVRLVSDDLTDVVIYTVGRLGTFKSLELDLRPGTYTVVGTRRGYRDVRLKLVIAAGKEPETLVVRCEEKL